MSQGYRDANAFMGAFQQGFSMVDDLAARRRMEAAAKQAIEERREHRNFQRGILLRDMALKDNERLRIEAARKDQENVNAILAADPTLSNPDTLNALRQFPNTPTALEAIQKMEARRQRTDDLIAINEFARQPVANQATPQQVTQQPGLQDAVTAAAGFDPQQPATPEQVAGVGAAELPGDSLQAFEAQAQEQAPLTPEQLTELAKTNPQEAAAIRDAQRAANIPGAQDPVSPTAYAAGEGRFRMPQPSPADLQKQEAQKQRKRAESQRDIDRNTWDEVLNINNPRGDTLRNLDASTKTMEYWRVRSSLRDDQKKAADDFMAPAIDETITEATAILTNPEVSPRDRANAMRKLKRANGLVQVRAKERGQAVMDRAGVDSRGYPKDERNQALTNSVIEQANQAGGNPRPTTRRQHNMDAERVNRGVKGPRIHKAFVDSVLRLKDYGDITPQVAEHLLKYGRFPTPEMKIEKLGKDQRLIGTDANGNVRILVPAEDEEAAKRGRNVIDPKVSAEMLDILKSQYGDDVGGSVFSEWQAFLGDSEVQARLTGEDLGNRGDMYQIFRKWNEMFAVKQAVADEWFLNGDWNPTFSDHFGNAVDYVFGEPSPREKSALTELEDPRAGMEGQISENIAPAITMSPQVREGIIRTAMGMYNWSHDEAEAALVEDGQIQ